MDKRSSQRIYAELCERKDNLTNSLLEIEQKLIEAGVEINSHIEDGLLSSNNNPWFKLYFSKPNVLTEQGHSIIKKIFIYLCHDCPELLSKSNYIDGLKIMKEALSSIKFPEEETVDYSSILFIDKMIEGEGLDLEFPINHDRFENEFLKLITTNIDIAKLAKYFEINIISRSEKLQLKSKLQLPVNQVR